MLGRKDVLSVKAGTSLKEKKWKRLLLDNIYNLHHKFNSTFSKNKVDHSKFFALRPSWVIPAWKQSQDVCKCVYHENINLICESLEKCARKKNLSLGFKSANSADAILTPTVHDTDRLNCFNQKLGDWTLNDMAKTVAYHGWPKKKVFEI